MIIDITRPIHPDMVIYSGDPEIRLTPVSSAGRRTAAVSALHLGTHTGTHVDPPSHLFAGGRAVDALDLGALIGPAAVVELTGAGPVTPDELAAALPAGVQRTLLRTHDGSLWRSPSPRGDYRGLAPAAAGWLVAAGVRLLGIDYLSVDPAGAEGLPAHRVLLAAGVVIVEGLDLAGVAPGGYNLACLPLRIAGGDGAPARAVLFT